MVTTKDPEIVVAELVVTRRKRTFSPGQLASFARRDQRVFDLLLRYRCGEPVGESIVSELLRLCATRQAG
jgi:hypothetical protein